MEFVHGRSLEQHLRDRGPFNAREAIAIGLDLCRAVSAVHAAGLLHRDIKAHNVTRAEDGRVVLMDFGTGRPLADSSASDLAGTPLYLAPEVLAGRPATVQSDIYSLGVLLYHLVTGSYPVAGRSLPDIHQAHERRQRVALRTSRPAVRASLARVIERAADPEPERRYATVDALARDLSSLQRRPAAVRFGLGAAAAAAVVLVALLTLEVSARVTGDRRGLGTRMASLIGLAPDYLQHPRIVVRPFRNASGQPADSLLVDNITAGLIRQLGIIDGLEARSETSSFMLRDKPWNLAEVGRRLNVNLVLEGDAEVSGSTVLVRAAVVSTAGDPVWSGRVERRLKSEGDFVGMVEELTRKVVNELRLTLGRTQRRYETADLSTLQLYWQARELRNARMRAPKAIPLLEEVLRRDSSYAPALATLAVSHLSRAQFYPSAGVDIPPTDAIALAGPLVRRALDLDPTLAEAHAALGTIHAWQGRWAESEAAFRTAIYYEPTLTALYGDFVLSTLLPQGSVDDALRTMQEAVQADPESRDARRVLGRVQLDAGLYGEALASCRHVLDQDPTYPFVEEICGLALMFQERMDEALAMFTKRAALNEHFIGYIYARTGRVAEAEALAARNGHLPHRQAMIYGALGDRDRAFAALDELMRLNPHRAAQYLGRPELRALHDDPRAAAFRRKLGLQR
jgi:serine/threonine-protein kinase